MSLIALAGVSKRFGPELILENVSFRIERGDHIGLVGSNGAGKSTLLRIIAGLEQPDSGGVSRTRGIQVAYLPQDPDFTETHTLYEVMLETFRAALDAQERLRTIERELADSNESGALVEEYGHLQAVVEHAGYDYREQIERVLTGLSLAPDTWYTPVSNLSGGQRTRANLGRTLLRDADVLLLDEPTNHLDIGALEWLESYLRDLGRAFVMVAHDRYLLDRVTKRTLELSFRKVTAYDAPYSRYLELRAERAERQRLDYEAQQEHIAKTEEFVRRFGAGQRSKEARGRQKRLDRLERVERPREESTVHLGLKKAQRSGDIVLDANHLRVGYRDRPLLSLPDHVVVARGEHVALIGPNGTGKTTLLRTLVGAIPPLHGTVRWGSRVTVGYYSQTLGQLDNHRTAIEEIQYTKPMSEEEARTYLGRFLFTGDDVFKTVSVLSGGEKSRIALAKLLLEEPNVLVLDEPTNHLDIASREALQKVLADFNGTLLFVSHDRYLIDSLGSVLWVVQDGELMRYLGGYTAYANGQAKALDRRDASGSTMDAQKGTTPEQRLENLEREAESLTTRLAQTGSTTSVDHLAELTERYASLLAQLDEAGDDWLRDIRAQLHASSV